MWYVGFGKHAIRVWADSRLVCDGSLHKDSKWLSIVIVSHQREMNKAKVALDESLGSADDVEGRDCVLGQTFLRSGRYS